MAAYGAQLNQGKSKAQATAYLTQLLKHTVAQPSSASNALQTFLSGEGDVLLDYEDDALYAQHQGEPISIVTPPQTILIQNPIAVTTNAANPAAAKAFVAYLLSPAGQKVWGQQGYRPVLPSVAAQFKFPKPSKLFTIDSLGGWTKVNTVFFTPEHGCRGQDRAGSRRLHLQWLSLAVRPGIPATLAGRRGPRSDGHRPGARPGRPAPRWPSPI